MNFEPLSQYLETLFDWGLPMYDCTVWQNHREVFRQKGGYTDLASQRTHEPDTRYFLYSCTKPVTTAAVLTLVEEGKIALSDPLSKYFPAFARMSVAETAADGSVTLRPAKGEITIWNLFTMTAGFNYNLNAPAIKESLSQKSDAFSSQDLAMALAKEPLVFDPGARWQYSLCHDVLAAVAEAVTGQLFGDFVRERIFAPLGMENTAYRQDMPAGVPHATQYHYDGKNRSVYPIPLTNNYVLSRDHHSGGAGMISTAEDFVRFGDAMAAGGTGWNGAKILSPETVAMWHKGALSPLQARTYNWSQFLGTTYGLGVYKHVSEDPLGTYSLFGWNGAAGSMLMICPEANAVLFYAQHTRENPEHPVCPHLRDVFFRCLRG